MEPVALCISLRDDKD